MGFLSDFRKDLQNAKRNKAANTNGTNLKELLTKFKEERDRIELETGIRPQIDDTTQMFMQKNSKVCGLQKVRKLMKKNFG
jgi:hypothetical protein